MSLISDALNKAQRDRAESPPPVSRVVHYLPVPERRRSSVKRGNRWRGAIGAVAVIALLLLGGFWYVRHEGIAPTVEPQVALAEPPAPPAIPPTAPLAAPAEPILPSREPPAATAVPTTDYALGGMTVVGPNTLLSINRRSDRRSIWIPVGKTVGEITAVSYDAASDQAVIRVNGRTLAVRMRDEAPGATSGVQPAE